MHTAQLKKILIRCLIPALAGSDDPLNRLLSVAAKAHLGKASEKVLLEALANYYASLDLETLKKAINYSEIRPKVKASGYKIALLAYQDAATNLWKKLGIWDRRLSLLRLFKIRIDVLFLARGQVIPPHAHRGVLSGFLLLEGASAIRHYNVEQYNHDSVKIKLTVDKTLREGEFTVNSEQQDNIHWLKGVAEESILYRFNITDLKSELPDYTHLAGRLYVDPTSATKTNSAEALFLSEEDAKNVKFS